MERSVLLLNAGSSSLKVGWYELANGRLVADGHADWAAEQSRFRVRLLGQSDQPLADSDWQAVSWRDPAAAVRACLSQFATAGLHPAEALAAVGHRVVHGGDFSRATRIDAELRKRIERLVELAPLHNGPCLEALRAAEEDLPKVPQIAVFDSGFHSTLPAEARFYALPWQWTSEWGIRRYGFHGLSHQYCSRRAAEWLADRDPALNLGTLRLVICHLGHGCSLAAIRGGQSIETTMGFTPLEGLMMATRSGSIDPGIIPYLQLHHGLRPEAIERALSRESGLLGVSGLSADLRELERAAAAGNSRARLAIAMYIHAIRKGIGGLVAVLGGLDALVFTAGVGENSSSIRAEVCRPLGFLGVSLDETANANCSPDAEISRPDSQVRVLVLATREEQEMFRQIRELLA